MQEARQRKIREKRKAWNTLEQARRDKGKPARQARVYKTAQLSQAEKEACETNIRPFGLLDYLYRLRIKGNYEAAEMFTEGPEDDTSSVYVAMSMVRIATSLMIAHETRIAQLLGKEVVLTLARDWVRKNTPPEKVGIRLRLPILEEVL
ncbi:Uncharacterised protein [Mycobacteroides abscessus subsp. abscessus]|nr:Uncharacterised protein [Mycobacteroides abscessus subsp. abscessus]SHS96215.1 Uncharacterised protein [Mycobacteroides abscessus subsp. abscessus]SHT26133.1 Uncharacterised protein [Mycobacteroides abscessus subsp. abscessus]SKF08563.1 Uncharacterised protein [Mycobacteroides abscessus subsp. abscessus]SKG75294.1 Uncharacterised protein [Mycobacteroides abscessus subsp. abscessus]